MKKTNFLITLILIFLMLVPASPVSAADNGVDDLRGRWDVEWSFAGEEGSSPSLILYINDIRASYYENTFYAGGCMRSPATDAFMPLSLRAVYNPEDNSYQVNLYSTVVPAEEFAEPYLIRFNGTDLVNGSGVSDDQASGSLTTEFAVGEWSATHLDRRRTKCPSLSEFGMGVQGDVSVRQDLAFQTPKNQSMFEIYSVIVSSGMLVERPDGSSFVVQEYTDIFSPDVDFIGRFRYLGNYDGSPVSGGTYRFVLLDVFGDPIPGTESTDIWTACKTGAPTSLETRLADGAVTLSWDPVSNVPGQFEPGSDPQIGFYQIGISPFNWEGGQEYGSNGIKGPSHIIPWNHFEPGDAGTPDGWDYGMSLSEFEDGVYQVASEAFSEPAPGSGGFALECAVFDTSQQLLMNKLGEEVSFKEVATISGRVTDETNQGPLPGIDVGACADFAGGNGFCSGNRTDANGYYTIVVPAGSYRVSVYGQPGWANEFYNNVPSWEQAAEVLVTVGQDTPNIDFSLAEAGSISGMVYDSEGYPLGGIGVDTEQGGYGTCTDENGAYSLEGLPLRSTVNVVAGRTFCGEHPFGEQTQEGVLVPADGVDFSLEVYNPILPTIIAQPEHEWIYSFGWTEGDEITVTFGDTFESSQYASPTGEVLFNNWELFDLAPGMIVTVSNGKITETLLVEEFSVDAYNETANTVSGTAPAGHEVGVGVHQPDGDYWLVVNTDETGNWFANFGAEDVNMLNVLDIHAMLWDADGDATQANYAFTSPP